MNTKQQDIKVITLLRVCTLLLAAVSFWSTAQGMREYTFPAGWQAYLASLGVQGLLLGLNFSFFRFWRLSETRARRATLVILTFVVLLCSSWFSYLYIAQNAYGQSWETESGLLAQGAYRNELFEADAYLTQYGDEMEQTLANQTSDLYNRASQMDSGTVDVAGNLDWGNERVRFLNSAARDSMDVIIDAMEQATAANATQDARQQSAEIVDTLRDSLQRTIEQLAARISEADERVEQSRVSVQAANQRLANAAPGSDTSALQRGLNTASQTLENAITRQSELVDQRQDYQTAYDRAMYYATLLGMTNEGVSSYYVGGKLREIQTELFNEEPDSGKMLNLATDVFDRLQGNVNLSGTGDYQELLSDMNRFVRSIGNYDALKTRSAEIQTLIDALAEGSLLTFAKADDDKDPSGWMTDWRQQFNELKSTISGLPVYTGTAGSEALRSYSREEATARLDKAIRDYLTEHNAAQQGLIYLASPYRSIAIFSLLLALLLDLAAFVTGFVIDRADVTEPQDKPGDARQGGIWSRGRAKQMPGAAEPDLDQTLAWNAIPPLNRYTFLTGDYQYLDGIKTYRAIEDGEETEVDCEDDLPAGFYSRNRNKLVGAAPAELLYQGADGGPRDGVYEHAVLQYNDQLLLVSQGKSSRCIGTVDPNTPVYLVSDDGYDMTPAKDMLTIRCKLAVVSLNETGTRIIAVYAVNE